MAADRRRAERERRAALRVPAVFAVKCVSDGRLELGQAEDVGVAGLTMRRPADVPLSPGTGIVLTFAVPGRPCLVTNRGVVVTDHEAGGLRRTGVRFLGLSPDEEQQIAAFCQVAQGDVYLQASVA